MKTTVTAYPAQKNPKGYIGNLGEAISQAIAAVFGLNCNLTFSAYCGYWQEVEKPLLGRLHVIPNCIMSLPRMCADAWAIILWALRGKDGVRPTWRGIDHKHCLDSWKGFV